MGVKNTIFGQMLQIISRYDFEKAVKWYQADKHSKGRLVSVLEGGYDLEGLGASVEAHIKALMRKE